MDAIITIVCLLGIISAIFTISLNANLVLRVVLKKSRRVQEMIIFYYRFVLDILFGVFLIIYLVFIKLSTNYPDYTHRPLIVYLALPLSNIVTCRSIIALSIAIERVLATMFPIRYRLYRPNFPNLIILSVGIIFGLSEWPVLFGFCSYHLEIPPTCRIFACSVNKCFYNFWTGHKTIIFCTIVILSIILSVRLFSYQNPRMSRANRLALLDTVTVVIFDFLPSFCGNLWPTFPLFNFDTVGPYNAVLKVMGCAIEASVVSTVLLPGTTVATSRRATLIKSSSQTFRLRSH